MHMVLRITLPFLLSVPMAAMAAPRALASADQVLAKHIAARGGLARILAIQSLTSTGHITIGPTVLDLAIANSRHAFRSDTSVAGMTKTEAFDGTQGWIIDPFTRGPGAVAEAMSAPQMRQMALQMDFDGPLVDARAKGHRIALQGLRKVHGVDAYVLQVQLADGDVLTSCIDAKTFMEIDVVNEAVVPGGTVTVETTLGDYRSVDGVMLPFQLEIRPVGQPAGMTIALDSVRANLPIDAARFRMP